MGKKKKRRKAGQPYKVTDPNPYANIDKDMEQYFYDKHTNTKEDKFDYETELELHYASVAKGGGYGSLWTDYWNCHSLNTKLLSSGRGHGGSLYIGGWSRGAHHTSDMTVFDLTGGNVPKTHRGTWYPISMQDFGVPRWSLFFWESLAMTIYHELSSGDVLMACDGGHGRSGMFGAIISYMLKDKRYVRVSDKGKLDTDPIWWMKDIHCFEAIETVAQEMCVYETCLEYEPNIRIEEALNDLHNKPRYVYKPVKYDNILEEWNTPDDEPEQFICPLCMLEHDTMIAALACCGTRDTLRKCPVCLTTHQLPVEAYNCCKVKSVYPTSLDGGN